MSPAAAQPASAARTPAEPRLRYVTVHLTPYAFGCGQLDINDKRRWKTFWHLPTLEVLQKVLARLRMKPGQVRVSLQANGDIAIAAIDRTEILIEGDPANDDPAPLALLFEDIQLRDVEAALQDLHRRGWIPSTLGAVQ